MIYIIVNQSHEWDDPIYGSIDFVSASLEKAEECWDEYYTHFAKMDNSKWCYSADLREYPNEFCIYSFLKDKFKVLKHVDNVDE